MTGEVFAFVGVIGEPAGWEIGEIDLGEILFKGEYVKGV